jgi:hypothetical protein
MPANWDLNQHLSAAGRVEWPTGPITDVDENVDQPKWVQAWVVQGGAGEGPGTILGGPSQSAGQSDWSGFKPGYWTAAEPGWINGQFTPGLAVGISLLALRQAGGTCKHEWWFELVNLQY